MCNELGDELTREFTINIEVMNNGYLIKLDHQTKSGFFTDRYVFKTKEQVIQWINENSPAILALMVNLPSQNYNYTVTK